MGRSEDECWVQLVIRAHWHSHSPFSIRSLQHPQGTERASRFYAGLCWILWGILLQLWFNFFSISFGLGECWDSGRKCIRRPSKWSKQTRRCDVLFSYSNVLILRYILVVMILLPLRWGAAGRWVYHGTCSGRRYSIFLVTVARASDLFVCLLLKYTILSHKFVACWFVTTADTFFYSMSDLNYDPSPWGTIENEGFLSYLWVVGNQTDPPLVHSLSYGDIEANVFNASNPGSVEYGTRCDQVNAIGIYR